MSDLTPERHAAIRARCDAASEGPWEWGAPPLKHWNPPDYIRVEDAVFIRHARQDVPDLLDALEAVESERDALPVIAKTMAEFRKEYGPHEMGLGCYHGEGKGHPCALDELTAARAREAALAEALANAIGWAEYGTSGNSDEMEKRRADLDAGAALLAARTGGTE